MTKITCEICMDLMPLVQDRLASPDSVDAVQHHLEQCPACIPVSGDSAMQLTDIFVAFTHHPA